MFNFDTQSSPTFNPFGLEDVGSRSIPAFVDIDLDGDLDAFIGENNGQINFFENTGTLNEAIFLQRSGEDNPFDGVDVGGDSSPAFVDIDGDGDLDAFLGEDDGNVNFFENTGTLNEAIFSERTEEDNPFDGVDVGSDSTPTFVDIDGDGDLDVFIGEDDGDINFFENIGTVNEPLFSEGNEEDNPFSSVDVGGDSSIAFVDIDGDGDLDALLGEDDGNIWLFENTAIPNTIEGTPQDDILIGTPENDILNALQGNDSLNGGAGDDILDGGAGFDELLGGAGADQFLLRLGQGTDTILDFEDGQDLLVLEAGLSFEQLTITDNNQGGTSISRFDGIVNEEIAFLSGIEPGLITEVDFISNLS
ncbi:MAG: calcium-binding protein [Coleofasciculaceae cyanobacterium]